MSPPHSRDTSRSKTLLKEEITQLPGNDKASYDALPSVHNFSTLGTCFVGTDSYIVQTASTPN